MPLFKPTPFSSLNPPPPFFEKGGRGSHNPKDSLWNEAARQSREKNFKSAQSTLKAMASVYLFIYLFLEGRGLEGCGSSEFLEQVKNNKC